jgi:hypothetical protein
MPKELGGIEKRLDELWDRLGRLEPLTEKERLEFDADPYLRDIAERNLEIAAQCCIGLVDFDQTCCTWKLLPGVEKVTSASLLRKIQTLAYDRIRVSPEFFLRLAAASF